MDSKEIVEEDLIIYTDGSSKGKPRRGGIGYRYILPNYSLQNEEYIDEWNGHYVQGTNNQMELKACIEALENIIKLNGFEKVKYITICTDSKYVKEHVSYAMFSWPKQGWLTSTGEPVENDDLWKKLIKLISNLSSIYHVKIDFIKVKAHKKGKDKDIHNDVADKLAKKGCDCPIPIQFRYVDVRKKISKQSTKKGIVTLSGQELLIRVIGCERKKTAKTYKIRYEVMSEESDFFECVDFIYNKDLLMEGHYYEVITEMIGEVPTITNVIREVEELLKKNQKSN